MGGRSSKYVNNYEYHAHLNRIQELLKELQNQQDLFALESRQNAKHVEDSIKEMNEHHRKQSEALNVTEQQVLLLKEKIHSLSELDVIKTNLHKITIQHDEDRVKLSSHLSDAISKEKGKWNDDVTELKERLESIKQYSVELISMDLQHEREIKDLQKRICRLETKMHYQNNSSLSSSSESKFPCSISAGGGDLTKHTSSNLPIHQKDSAFVSQHASMVEEVTHNCKICEGDDNNDACVTKPFDSTSSYHLKFSKINMAMKKLKDDIKFAERKKNSPVQ